MTSPRPFVLYVLGLLLAAWLTGCTGSPAEPSAAPTAAPSPWSRPLALDETTLTGSPALVMTGTGWALAWTEGAALRFAIIQPDGAVGPAQTVVLGRAPWNLTLLPIPGGDWHLLWQDTDRLGEVRLYSALLAPDGTLSRGPLALAPDPITAYTAAVAENGTAAVIWSDASARPQLFGRAIDAAGRPSATGPLAIASGATHPALAAVDSGGWLLTWLQRPASPHTPDTLWNVMLLSSASALPWDGVAQPQTIGSVVLGGPVEYVEQLSLGLDESTGYVLATTRHAGTGQAATALLAFDRFSLTPLSAQTTTPVPDAGWAVPADSQRADLPIALDVEGRLQIATFQHGARLGLEALDLDTGGMRWPVLRADDAGDLSLMWVVPAQETDQPGRLWMITTRPINPDD